MWDVVSLHVSFMFYICRKRRFQKRCSNSIIIIAFSLLVLAGFYGIYSGKEAQQQPYRWAGDTPLRRPQVGSEDLGLRLPVDKDRRNDNIYENKIKSEPYMKVAVADNLIDSRKENVNGKKSQEKNVDFYPGFDKPWKKFPEPIILEPQAVPAQHIENHIVKQAPNIPHNQDDLPKADVKLNPSAKKSSAGRSNLDDRIHLAVVCCGDRSEETLVMLKTAILNTRQKLVFHIFAEDQLKSGLSEMLMSWPPSFQDKMEFQLHSIQFPKGENPEEWKKVFKTCATQRLFLPDILTDVDSLLYVDTDILFIRPVDSIWAFFKKFNATQLAALAPEHEIKNIGWYNRFARHPYYGMTGLNSGVMLMNLTRMRAFGWTQKIVPIYREYKFKITWGDQDLINILFSFHPDRVFVYPCEWNFRPDHCMYSNNCYRVNDHGVAVIHGNRGVYHNEKQWPFRMIYEAFLNFQLGSTPEMHLIQPLQRKLSEPKSLNLYCGKTLINPLVSTLRKACQENV